MATILWGAKKMVQQIRQERNKPVQLSAPGINSLFNKGGILMLYKRGCPSCEQLHVPGSASGPLSALAHRATAQGVTVGVANGVRLRASLPADLEYKTYPAIFVAPPNGKPELYRDTVDRSPQAILNFYHSMERGGVEAPQESSIASMDLVHDYEPTALAMAERAIRRMKRTPGGDGPPAELTNEEEVAEALAPTSDRRAALQVTDMVHERVADGGAATAAVISPHNSVRQQLEEIAGAAEKLHGLDTDD